MQKIPASCRRRTCEVNCRVRALRSVTLCQVSTQHIVANDKRVQAIQAFRSGVEITVEQRWSLILHKKDSGFIVGKSFPIAVCFHEEIVVAVFIK